MRNPAILILVLALTGFGQDAVAPLEAARQEIRTAHELLAEADAGAKLGRGMALAARFVPEAQAAYQEALSSFEQDRNLEARELAASARFLLRAEELLWEAQQTPATSRGERGADQSARRYFQRTSANAQELQGQAKQAGIKNNTLDSISRKTKAILEEAERCLKSGHWQRAIALTRAADTAIVAGGHLAAGRKLAMAGTEAQGSVNSSSAFQQKQ